jgi:hypothetical protein
VVFARTADLDSPTEVVASTTNGSHFVLNW